MEDNQSDDFGFFFENFEQSVLEYKEYLVRTPKKIVKKRKSGLSVPKSRNLEEVASDDDSDSGQD